MNKLILMTGTWMLIYLLTIKLKLYVGDSNSIEIIITSSLISTALTFLTWGWFI